MLNARTALGLLVLAFLVTFSALSVAKFLNSAPAEEIAASASWAPPERRETERTPLFSRELEHFKIMYEGGTQQSIGDQVGSVLERGYRTIGKTLNTYPSKTIGVILYSNREFQDLTRSPSWATGRYDGRIRIAIGGALEPPRDLDRIVMHELVHAVIASAAPRGIPAWLNEGLASHLESTDRSWAAHVLRSATTIVPLEDLTNGFGRFDEQDALVAYAESATAAAILCAQLGPNIGPFLRMVGNGSSVDDALLEYHVQPNAFHAEWRRRVGLR
jgi:Peptidase MA superfamily